MPERRDVVDGVVVLRRRDRHGPRRAPQVGAAAGLEGERGRAGRHVRVVRGDADRHRPRRRRRQPHRVAARAALGDAERAPRDGQGRLRRLIVVHDGGRRRGGRSRGDTCRQVRRVDGDSEGFIPFMDQVIEDGNVNEVVDIAGRLQDHLGRRCVVRAARGGHVRVDQWNRQIASSRRAQSNDWLYRFRIAIVAFIAAEGISGESQRDRRRCIGNRHRGGPAAVECQFHRLVRLSRVVLQNLQMQRPREAALRQDRTVKGDRRIVAVEVAAGEEHGFFHCPAGQAEVCPERGRATDGQWQRHRLVGAQHPAQSYIEIDNGTFRQERIEFTAYFGKRCGDRRLIIGSDGKRVDRRAAERVARAAGQGQNHRLVAFLGAVVVDGNRNVRGGCSSSDRQRTGVLDGEVVAAARGGRTRDCVADRQATGGCRLAEVDCHIVRAGVLVRARRGRRE